jgi:hypothetical protein
MTFFRLARGPGDYTGEAEIASSRGAYPELYGWERLAFKREQLVICDGEFDRLILETYGFPAVTAVASDGEFLETWAPHFGEVENVFVCFHKDESGAARARQVADLISDCRVVQLPAGVGEGGTVADFFTRLGMGRDAFLALLPSAGSEDTDFGISSSLS